MSKEESPNYKEGLKQLAKNLGAVGVGSAAGYFGGGLLTKKVVESKKFRRYYKNLSPEKRKALSNKIRMTGALAGTAAGGLSSYALSNAFNKRKEEEKVASLCVKVYSGYV